MGTAPLRRLRSFLPSVSELRDTSAPHHPASPSPISLLSLSLRPGLCPVRRKGSHDEIYSYACGVSNGMRPLIPRSWPQSVAMLITDCWEPLPENRPSFREILERLEACREDVAAMDRALTNRHCCCFM